mmetsp:Transcript_15937/g.37595  ORF Transcript_15937/g.37595 Transcript_15937/m.37595 type:complete len:89 (+) Transcript_15937:1898-2164(+)
MLGACSHQGLGLVEVVVDVEVDPVVDEVVNELDVVPVEVLEVLGEDVLDDVLEDKLEEVDDEEVANSLMYDVRQQPRFAKVVVPQSTH